MNHISVAAGMFAASLFVAFIMAALNMHNWSTGRVIAFGLVVLGPFIVIGGVAGYAVEFGW